MKPTTTSLLAIVLGVVLTTPACGATGGKVPISSKLKTVEIVDPAWGIVAFRMEIPENWTFEGVLLRDPKCDMLPAVAYRLASPDGLAGYQVLPQFGWHWSDDPQAIAMYRNSHCKTMQPLSAAEFLKYVVPAVRPDATLGPVVPTRDAAEIDASIAQYNARAQQSGMPTSMAGGAVSSRVEYTFHGQRIEESVRVVVSTFDNQFGGHHLWSSVADVAGFRAPKGQLDEVAAVLSPGLAKASYTPEWQARMQRKQQADQDNAMATIKTEGERTRVQLANSHDAYMRESQRKFDASQQLELERQAAVHRSAVAWTLYAGDEQLVRNPSTGEVSRVTTANGTHGYQDATSGDIVMSNDPSFDPSYYVRGTWTQLENVNPLRP